jgi:hypothetical protein
MLNQLKHLSQTTEGRYATDAELHFIADYVQSFDARLQTYLKLQQLEPILVQQTYNKVRSIEASSFHYNNADMSAKWKLDTVRVLRYTAIAMLMDDPQMLQENLLLWFRTVIRAFGVQRNSEMTYHVLQNVMQQHLSPHQMEFVRPFLELNRSILGAP